MYNLSQLGWYSFQQLAIRVAKEVFGQTVGSFPPSNEGGRDGCFTGTWVSSKHDSVEIKEDAKSAIQLMHALNIKTVMLSGDKQAVVDNVAKTLNIDQALGDLLPENKVEKVEESKRGKKEVLAFVGDGINDAPVLAISDVGIAMGGLGSDAAIETANVVIQTDQPSKIVTAIKIGKATNAIVWQNIALAFGVKIIKKQD